MEEVFESIRKKEVEKVKKLLEEFDEEKLNSYFQNYTILGYSLTYLNDKKGLEIFKNILEKKGLNGNFGFLNDGPNEKEIKTPLFLVCESEVSGTRKEALQCLLKLPKIKAEFGRDYEKKGWEFLKETPLNKACKEGKVEYVKVLLSSEKIDVNEGVNDDDDYHIAPIVAACKNNHADVVKLLLLHPDIDFRDIQKKLSGYEKLAELAKEKPQKRKRLFTTSEEVLRLCREFDKSRELKKKY